MKVISTTAAALLTLAPLLALAENPPAPTEPVRVIGFKSDGGAVIRVCADKQGRPFDISIVQSSGNKDMDKAVFRAAKSWRFPPIKPDGTARQECEDVPVELKLKS